MFAGSWLRATMLISAVGAGTQWPISTRLGRLALRCRCMLSLLRMWMKRRHHRSSCCNLTLLFYNLLTNGHQTNKKKTRWYYDSVDYYASANMWKAAS